jgi:hypothetical protein
MKTLGLICVSTHADLLDSLLKWAKWTQVFDEITIVADSDGGPEVEKVTKEYTNNYIVKKVNYIEEALQDVINLSHTDWQFKIDDDERMGECFIDDIRNFIETTKFDSIWFPRAWLYPDKEHFISNSYWYPDNQPRLWKQGTARGIPELHQYPSLSSNYTILDWNIYHFALLESMEYRLKKCQAYADIWKMSLENYKSTYGSYLLPEYKDSSKLKIIPIKEKFVV